MNIVLRLDSVNPVHTRLSIFTSGKRSGIVSTTRGLSGELCIDTEVFEEFVTRLQPDAITTRTDFDPETVSDEMASFIDGYNARTEELA